MVTFSLCGIKGFHANLHIQNRRQSVFHIDVGSDISP
jgi:hypothetical protein